jgi:phenylalanyl-tRNA synthetase beta chain
MKVTYNWLKDYLKIDISPDKLADRLTMAGLEVTSLKRTITGDWLMDLEVTTNRPDWLSVLGLARETGAITNKSLISPITSIRRLEKDKDLKMQALVLDPRGCLRYTARLITNLQTKPTPQWMKERLEAIGLRSVNMVVDITNFVLLEYGQPLHAFDYDKLNTDKVIVRRARKGEKLIAIDQRLIEFDPEMLVIANEDRPIALAGIIGGKNFEVDEGTKRILLESAYFDPILIRKTSRKLGLVSESSYRFERGVDPEGLDRALDRACYLLEKLAGGKINETIIDVGKKYYQRTKISLDPVKANKVLGIKLSNERIVNIFRRLELPTVVEKDGALQVEIPGFRRDLSRPIDLIEEIGRLSGYQNIPIVIPKIRFNPPQQSSDKPVESKVRQLLISAGLVEVINYSLISRQLLKKINMETEEVISIKNPLTREQEIMRPNLLGGILNVIAGNRDKGIDDIRIFELSRVYLPKGVRKLPAEQLNLAVALSGRKLPDWREKSEPFDFYNLKGLLEECLARLGIDDYEISYRQHSSLRLTNSACLKIKGEQIGYLGEVRKDILNNFGLNDPIYIFECNFDSLASRSELKKRFKPFIKYPSITYDIAVVVKKGITSQEITDLINASGGRLVSKIRLFDVYQGRQIPDGYKSLAYSIEYQAPDRTLTAEEVEKIHSKIRQTLQDRLNAQIR